LGGTRGTNGQKAMAYAMRHPLKEQVGRGKSSPVPDSFPRALKQRISEARFVFERSHQDATAEAVVPGDRAGIASAFVLASPRANWYRQKCEFLAVRHRFRSARCVQPGFRVERVVLIVQK
jgi:hypothetical protein